MATSLPGVRTRILVPAFLRQRGDCLSCAQAPIVVHMTTTLITGANKGLGKATARRLVAAGHAVYLGARNEELGRSAAAEVGARFVHLDVTDDASVAAALKTIEADGALDVLVNNAGIATWEGAGEALDGPSVLEVFDTNAVGVIRVTEAALPLLRKSANPVVVNVSSALGSFWATHEPTRPAFGYPSVVYGSSKAAVSMITVQYAKAVPEVKFNAVEPGITATELGGGDPGSHPGRPADESAEVVARLAMIDADGPTGTFQEDAGELGW
jgi:NAD(P)-dependent dehydrogenase (short-subunit alcohol dehydrogenase family)